MSQWVLKGLLSGIRTTRYPARDDTTPGVSPGLPVGGHCDEAQARCLVALCPTGALAQAHRGVVVDDRRCIHCFRCVRQAGMPIAWDDGYRWARATARESTGGRSFGRAFRRSVHILVVDAGDCGACLNEVRQLSGPYYNLHRLGFFITPTPRQADLLLVVGPVTDHMRAPLVKAYRAMPTPKRVIAVGACALSGSVFGPSFACGGGVGELLPVDVEVPGQPPPPLAILDGLLLAAGRRPASTTGSAERDSSLEAALKD
jgi:Ni,Fe-hydrogenase III small subunit